MCAAGTKKASSGLGAVMAFLAMLVLAPGAVADNRNAAVTVAAPAASETKVALVIGNSAYQNGAALKNPVNDAHAMAEKLRALGFDVIERRNVKAREYGPALREFRTKLRPGAVAVFFYAGHGLQVNGKNYFPAVDADIQGEEDVPTQSLDMSNLFMTLDQAKTRLNLVFLDACRNNPYASAFRSVTTGGLARVDAPSGTLISYATRPGSVASDGEGGHGLYTSVLLQQMDIANLSVEQLHKRVVAGVKQGSRGMQEPWMEGSVEGEFSFRPEQVVEPVAKPDPQPSATPATPAVTLVNQRDDDGALWADTKQAGTEEAYLWYLEKFPNGLRAGLARAELAKLRAAKAKAAEDEDARARAQLQAEAARREAAAEEARQRALAAAAARQRQEEEERQRAAAEEEQRIREEQRRRRASSVIGIF